MDSNSAEAKIWAMSHLGTPMAVRVAATLRVADHIAAGVHTAAELATIVGADADSLDRLLRFLAARGVFTRDDGEYRLNELAEPLRSDHPSALRGWLDIEGAGRPELAFVQLLHCVRTGEPGYPQQFGGRSFWDDMAARPERTAAFSTAMSSDIPVRSREIVAGYDWGSLGRLVDVGGGDGALLSEILQAHPGLRGTVFDQPAPASKAAARLKSLALDDRAEAVGGTFFDPLPAGADGYVLSVVLHNWSDVEAVEILRRCAEAAGRDGKVFIIENIGPDGSTPPTGMDLRMLAYRGGKERGLADFTKLAADVKLAVAAVHPAGSLSIIELVAA